MPIKRILITHTLSKGCLGKGLEHYRKNRLRSMTQDVPKLNHDNYQDRIKIPKFCGL